MGTLADALKKSGLQLPNSNGKTKDKRQSQNTSCQNQSSKNSGNVATAPYNFIPLPEKAIESPLGKFLGSDMEKYGAYIDENGKLSGSIDISIETLTPMCINWDSQFYAPNGLPTIPGSTLRGMFKNYLKIISCGTMRSKENEDITSRHLYYRDIASSCKELKNAYRNKMIAKETRVIDGKSVQVEVSKASAGFLARLQDKSYVIFKADVKVCPYERKKDGRGKPLYKLDKQGKKKYFYIIPPNCENKILAKSDYVECHTGNMFGKGHYYVLSNANWDNPIELENEKMLLSEYREDKNRKGLDLLDPKNSIAKSDFARGHKFEHLVPCFFLENRGKAVHFGYGKYYRIPYDKAVEDHIPKTLKDKNIVDFAEAIFGRKEDFASRVFFEDAVSSDVDKLLQPSLSHNLMGPNPTSFQLYIEQNGKGLAHWDDSTNIRGYKMYWHQDIGRDDWKFDSAKDKKVKGVNPIQPIQRKALFTGRIRFENLAKEELGALLAILDLGNKGMFKVGIGKSLGMGSIKLSGTVNIIDQAQRYAKLFSEDGWNQGIDDENVGTECLTLFYRYINAEVKNLKIQESYDNVLNNLDAMMDWGKKPGRDKVSYMPIGDKYDTRYKDRVVLGRPVDIVRK